MKTSLFLIAGLAGLCLAACSKTNRAAGNHMITGKWELREQIGDIAGKIEYEPGNGNTCVFSGDSSFQTTHANIISLTGTYKIKPSANSGDWLLTFQFIQNGQAQSQTDSVRFGNMQLIFLPQASCCDIPTTYYQRLY